MSRKRRHTTGRGSGNAIDEDGIGDPEKFFPGTQIDIVFYPQGKDGDPNNFTETEPFRGPVHLTLRKALNYLKYMVVRKNIHKPKDDEHSIVVYNYPYQALERSVHHKIWVG